jgi:hypothetical protein
MNETARGIEDSLKLGNNWLKDTHGTEVMELIQTNQENMKDQAIAQPNDELEETRRKMSMKTLQTNQFKSQPLKKLNQKNKYRHKIHVNICQVIICENKLFRCHIF